MATAKVSEELLASLKLAKVFPGTGTGTAGNHATSLEFDPSGEHCVVGCAGDESIVLYDALDGRMKKTVYSKKYGVGPVRFTHRANNVVYASGKGEPMIRYLSLHDNAYLRYFKGHEAAVTALEMSPVSDLLVSGAANDTVRLWDLRSAHCHGVLATTGVPLLAFDPRGLVFALALDSKHIRLFDVHSYDRGPFAAFEIVDPARAGARWTAIRFSPDGRELLVATAAGAIYLIDSFDGYVKQVLTGNQNSAHLDLQPAFTPDAQFVLCGSQDGRVHAWSRATGRQVAALEGHAAAPRVLAFNPKHAMLASACTSLAFWIPEQ